MVSKSDCDILIPTNNVQEFQLFHILTTLDFIKIFIYLCSVAYGILVPPSGIEPVTLHWNCRFLTTGPPEPP